MLPQTDLGEKTRRAVLKAAGAALGIATVGSAKGHPGSLTGENNKFYGGTQGYLGDNVADASESVDLVGYHSGGGVGPASLSGQPEDAHRGAMSEMRIHDDLAFVSIFSARGGDSQRGVAILDISDFTRAESKADLESAELTLLSFVRNDNSQSACMDVKVSDDGDYIFVCKQAVTALFGEGLGSEPNAKNHGTTAGVGSLIAVDVSDPGNPEVTDEESLSHWSVGPHNGWYHQIGGTEYFFTVHGTSGAASAVNAFQFDRSSGQLQQVNAWSWDTNLAAGEYGIESNQWYHHDLQIQEDPRTGRPLAYVHCWDAGLRIFDVSDPLDPREVGVFEQEGAHHAVPGPALINGKRVVVTGHENPDSHYHDYIGDSPGGETGRYHLIDLDALDRALDPDDVIERVYLGCASTVRGSDIEPRQRAPYQMYDTDAESVLVLADQTELDTWTLIGEGEGWEAAPGFEEEAEKANEDPDGESEENPGEYDGFSDFRLSSHNLDMDTKGRLYAGHYHAGARFFQITNDFEIEPTGYFREGKEVPTERTMGFDDPTGTGTVEGLTAATPFFWNAVERNGVVFSSGINGGPHVMHHDDATVGDDTPVDVDIERDHDSAVALSTEAYRVTISVDTDEDVLVRDAVPTEWTVLEEYSPAIRGIDEIDGYRRIVELDVEDGEASYIVETPETFGSYTFGPVEYALADDNGAADVDSDYGGGNTTTNRLWRKDNAAVDSVTVVGTGSPL